MTQIQKNQIETTDRTTQIINHLRQGKTHEQIAQELQISRATVERDLRAFVESPQFRPWLKQEFLRLHAIILKEDPKECYRTIARLIRRAGDISVNQANLTQIRIVFGNDDRIQAENVNVVDDANYTAE